MYYQILCYVYAALFIVMSIAAIIVFCIDKVKAMKGQIRVQEKTLLSLAVLGGGFGAYVGRIIAHHKTNKIYFTITIWLSLVLQLAIFALLIYKAIMNGGLLL